MPFPETKRTIYENNPLAEVVCQVRFPPILRVDTEIPTAFQEAIKSIFPLYSEKIEYQNQVAFGINPNIPSEILNQLSKSSINKNHEFSDIQAEWKINLTRTFLAMTTTKYIKWEEFIGKFSKVFEAFHQIYEPPFYSRIGLRYIDIFSRNKLNLSNVPWRNLFQPYILGLNASSISENIENQETVNEINLADDISKARIVTSFAIDAKTSEKCYMIDSDFYTPKRIAKESTGDKLEFLHLRATRLIKWAISDQLHAAMKPTEI